MLYELEAPPLHLSTALISRVKVMSGLDISETRVPQDGRIDLSIGGRPVDLRVSTLPTMFGESCVMRVLDRSVVSLDLEQIGLRDKEVEQFKELIALPHGIILVTGPTGSGKTTTLYAGLNYANDVAVKIITTEDPVEYDLDGIVQVQVNEEIGVTYQACLRSILRQDPDMILVGEIRDRETAQIAVEASLTGHVVFSTLHTNDAPLAITRLVDIGVEPFLIAATLEGVVGQRLVRRICLDCKEFYEPVDRDPPGARFDRRSGGGEEVRLREGLRLLQQHGLPGAAGDFRDHDGLEHDPGAHHGQGADLPRQGYGPARGHAYPARERPVGDLRRGYHGRGGPPGDHGLDLGIEGARGTPVRPRPTGALRFPRFL